jgi:hypothetical protein
MSHTRRRWLKGAGLGMVGAGFLSRVDQVAAAQAPTSLRSLLAEQAKGGKSEALLLGPTPGEEGPPWWWGRSRATA